MVRHITYCTVQPAKSPSLLTHALAASTSPPPREVDWGALRWLVLDEADRLLAQPYQGWLEVLERTKAPPPAPPEGDCYKSRGNFGTL